MDYESGKHYLCRWFYKTQNIIFQNLPLGIPNIDAKIIPFINVNGMKKFLKKSCFIWGKGKLATFQVAREELWSLFSYKNLEKVRSFLYHHLWRSDSKSSSWYCFSFEFPLVAPVKARQALYWTDSIFSWTALL